MNDTPDEFNDDYISRTDQLNNPYTNHAERDMRVREFRETYSDTAEESDETVTLAGRITRFNDIGNIVFADIRDQSGVVQTVFRDGSTDGFEERENTYVGDYIQVTGEPTRTNTGEFSLDVYDWEILTPAARDVPMRTGLSEQQQAHDRVGAMLVDEDLHNSVATRFEVQNQVRDYLNTAGFEEVRTPVLHDTASGAAATPFETHANTTDEDMYLRVAPELYLKRLVMAGFEDIYEIGSNFRNEDADSSHNPEFTMLELYQAYADYEDMMELTENLVSEVVESLTGDTTIEYGGEEIDFSPPWVRVDYIEAVEDAVGHEVSEWNDERLFGIVEARVGVEPASRADAYEELYDEFVEPELTQPTFVIDHPRESTPLCAPHSDNPERVERFEAVVAGMELANAYSELTDPLEQADAFERQSDGEESYDSDSQFVEDLGYGMPPTGGLGIGLDRLAMLVAGEESIRRVLPFPIVSNGDE